MFIEILIILLAIIFLIIGTVFPLKDVNIRWRTLRALAKLPGPKGIPILGIGYFIGTLPETEFMSTLEMFCKKFPKIMGTYVAGIPFVVLGDPEYIELVLGSVHHIKKGYEYDPIRSWLDDGLLVSSGDKWHQRRKLLTPAFHFRILEDNLQSLNKHARYLLRNMLKKEGNPFVAEQLVSLCTLDVICETAMGFSLNSQDDKAKDYVGTVKRISNLVVLKITKFWLRRQWVFSLTESGKYFLKGLKLLHNFSERIIRERKVTFNKEYSNVKEDNLEDASFLPKKKKAFLDTLLELDKKYPNLFTDLDIREEVDTFMFEGHDTTSAAIVFALFLLGQNPEIQEKTYEELNNIFGDSDRAATNSDLHEMHYLELVIKETLRLYPSVPYFSRVLTQDLKLPGDNVIPSNVTVCFVPYFLHRNSQYFPNPEVFDPERFTIENSLNRHPYSYIPFSAGPRNCIGQKFAMMELKVVLSTIIRFSKIEPVTKLNEFIIYPYLVIRTDPPIRIKVIPRNVEVTNNVVANS